MRILRWAGRFWTGVLVVAVALAGLLLGVRLALPLFDAPPTLRDSSPADGTEGIAARARPVLRFDRPMNPRSVERALQISPPTAWSPIWNADLTTLTISPTETLRSETAYSITLSDQALSRRFRRLAAPITLHFRTAQAPAVVAALPADNAADVALDSPISIRFSRTIVPESALMQATTLPELQFEPPIAGSAIWLDPATVLFRPTTPLRPGTHYRALLAATLADVNGGELSNPFSWSFSTSAPRVLATTPSDNARLVAPRATIALTVSQPLALESLRASLTFSPTINGQLTATDLPTGEQLITFHPNADLQPATTYLATLGAGAAPVSGNLPLLQPLRWSFTTAPHPALTGRFPGEGQTLPNGQEIRLVFNTPMDSEAFRAAVQLTPPAQSLDITSSDSEIHVEADLRAATVYTMTLPATLTDRNGVALGQEYRIRFQTAPSGPMLELPELSGHLAQIAPGSAAELLVRRTNLSGLNADLYRLDEAALVRTLDFQESDWIAFQPERYNQALLRSWRIPLSDQLNSAVEARLPLTLEGGQALAEGAYYLRLRSLEGPRADVLLLVTRARLTLQNSGAGVLIWATDTISATPAIGLPIALYRAGVLVRQGTTAADGTLRFDNLAPGAPAYIAVAAAPSIGVGSAAGSPEGAPGAERMVFVSTDRAVYQPGETVQLAGFVRAAATPTGTLALAPGQPIGVSIRQSADTAPLYQASLSVSATGVFSAAVPLAADTAAGQYTLLVNVGGTARQVGFAVRPDARVPLDVGVATPPALLAGTTAPISVTVRTLEGLPVAGATVSWTLDAERALLPSAEGLIFGDDERAPSPLAQRSGAGQTDANGQLLLSLADLPAGDVPLRYRLVAWATEPGGSTAAGSGSFVVTPAQRIAGVRLPSRIFTVGQRGAVDLLTLDADGQPAPATSVRVEVYRRTWAQPKDTAVVTPSLDLVPHDRLALTRSITTGPDGTASLPITLPAGGAYRLRVSVAGENGQPVYSATTAWATALGFTNWGDLPGGQPLLIADRPSYRPGDTATLLVTMPQGQATALISHGGASGLSSHVETLRAGSTFTVTVEGGALELPVSVLLATRATQAGNTIADPPSLPVARASLPIVSDRQALDVAIAADRSSYAPQATANLTITTSLGGVGVPADVILSIASAASAPEQLLAAAAGSTSRSADQSVQVASKDRPDAQEQLAALPAGITAFWNPALRTNASGVLTLTLQLPNTPTDLRASAWAASADRLGQAQSTLVVTRPIGLRLVAPPVFRAGDEVELAAYIQNTGLATQSITTSLDVEGLEILPDSTPAQSVDIAAGATARLGWRARVLDAGTARVSVSAGTGTGPPQIETASHTILPAAPDRAPHDGGIALLREYLDPLTGTALDPAGMRAGQLVRVRLTVVNVVAHGAITIDEPLPAGALLVASGDGDPARMEPTEAGITLEPPASAPAIKQYSYVMRLVAGGRYSVPAPSARAADGASGVGNTIVLDIAGR